MNDLDHEIAEEFRRDEMREIEDEIAFDEEFSEEEKKEMREFP